MVSKGNFEESLRVIHDYLGLERKGALDQVSRLARENPPLIEIKKTKRRGQKEKKLVVRPEIINLLFQLTRAPYNQEIQESLERYVHDEWLRDNFPLGYK